jgi:DNA repair photolyase
MTKKELPLAASNPTTSRQLSVTVANRAKLIVPTGFKGYDVCLNSYVGCQFGCRYCYVRFFVKDDDYEWGEFVRLRAHIDKLPWELNGSDLRLPSGKVPRLDPDGQPILKDGKQVMRTVYRLLPQERARLVIGTMTDPYQPQEGKYRLTRAALDALLGLKTQLNKVGIFTRSPTILDDLDRIVLLPRKRVHFTITPYAPSILKKIEPIAIPTERRFETVRALKKAGVRVHVNVAPALPLISDDFTEEFAARLAELKVNEFFVDPMQPYTESFKAIDEAMRGEKIWAEVRRIVNDPHAFQDWKDTYRAAWERAWRKVRRRSPKTMPIYSDHVRHVWTDMRTGEQMDFKIYGDEIKDYA